MESWRFLTNHARVLLCISQDPDLRLRDAAAALGITERSAYGIINDLTTAGYVVKQKTGRRNRYQIQADLPLPGPGSHEPAIGDVLALLSGDGVSRRRRGPARAARRSTTGLARPLADARASGPETGQHHAGQARVEPVAEGAGKPPMTRSPVVNPLAALVRLT